MEIVFTADWHLGHPRTPCDWIIQNLKEYFLKRIEQLHKPLIFLGGDIFDRSLSFNDTYAPLIVDFFHNMFQTFEKIQATCLAVRGTYNHDYNQLAILEKIASKYPKVHFKLFIKPEPYFLSDYNLYLLFLPDDLPFNSFELIKQKILEPHLKALNISKFDIIVGHGTFFFTDFAKYLSNQLIYDESILNYANLVLFGHYHVPCEYNNRIFYSGSFDRLAFNEEHAKGYYIFNYNNNNYQPVFIVNHNAMPYITITQDIFRSWLNNLSDTDKWFKYLKSKIKTKGYIRLLYDDAIKENPKFQEFKTIFKEFIKDNFPLVQYTYQKKASNLKDLQQLLEPSNNLTNNESLIVEDIDFENILLKDLVEKAIKTAKLPSPNPSNLPGVLTQFFKNIPFTVDDIKNILKVIDQYLEVVK